MYINRIGKAAPLSPVINNKAQEIKIQIKLILMDFVLLELMASSARVDQGINQVKDATKNF